MRVVINAALYFNPMTVNEALIPIFYTFLDPSLYLLVPFTLLTTDPLEYSLDPYCNWTNYLQGVAAQSMSDQQ